MSQPDYSCDFPGIVQSDENCYRFTDKSIQSNERVVFSNWWREQINLVGYLAAILDLKIGGATWGHPRYF